MKPRASGRNTVRQQLPTLADVTCCVPLHTLLHVVAQSLKPVKLLSKQLPTFLLLRNRRSVAQQCWIRLLSLRPRKRRITHGLLGVYKVLWVVSFPRPTAGRNNVGGCCICYYLFARSLTSSSLRTYQSLRLKLPFEYFSWNPTKKSVTLLCTDGLSLQLSQVELTLDRTFEKSFNVSVRFPMMRYSVIDSARIRTSVRRERLAKHENLFLQT